MKHGGEPRAGRTDTDIRYAMMLAEIPVDRHSVSFPHSANHNLSAEMCKASPLRILVNDANGAKLF